MKYTDRIYGEFEIDEPVLLELIAGPSLQRLKGIDQAGYYEPHFPGISHSRFEHSMGVFCLLRKYGASLEEQIAGLIHDVSHSAFSHCIDYIKGGDGGKNQEHQDNLFDDYVRKSEIPAILGKYGIDLNYILDDANFPLKERPLPDLCADRIDYSLRTTVIMGEMDKDDVGWLLSHLKVTDNRWVFGKFEYARLYTNLFRMLNSKYWAGLPGAAMHSGVGAYLKHALGKGYITWDDLYVDDSHVMGKIACHHAQDRILRQLFDRMNLKVKYVQDRNNFESRIYMKSRVVDPLFIDGKALKRVSAMDQRWANDLKSEQLPKEYFIRFEEAAAA